MKRILTSQKIYCTDSFIVREGIVLRNVLEGGDIMWTNLTGVPFKEHLCQMLEKRFSI